MNTSTGSPADVPAFIGFVETTVHALRLIHAARQGVIPRITRRLNDAERRTMIKSGAVFVFSVEESGIKRWTDGLLWSPSRIVGNFLVYREINERSSSRSAHKKTYHGGDPSPRSGGGHSPTEMSATFKGNSDQGTFKTHGLIKKTITVTVEGSDLHLVSYYTSEDVRSGRLKRPTSRPDIMALYMPPQIFRFTNFRNPPKVEIGADGKPRLVCEAEDNDAPEVKAEESPSYHGHGGSPSWSSSSSNSPVDNHYQGGSSLYPVSHTSDYARPSSGDRWPMSSMEGLRSPASGSNLPWTLPTLPAHLGQEPPGRRDSAMTGEHNAWTPSSRWEGGYSTSSNPGLFLERSRMRSGSGYQGMLPLARSGGTSQDDTRSSSFSNFHSLHLGVSRPQQQQAHTNQQRTSAWISTPGPHERDARTPHPVPPFNPSTSSSQQPAFSAHGYHHAASHSYGSTQWSPADTLDLPSQAPFASQSSLHSYDASFTAGSGTLSSPDDYHPTKVEDFEDT